MTSLGIDSAFGRMENVSTVSQVDYYRDEVTFRIELKDKMSAEEFAKEFERQSSLPVTVVSTTLEGLTLRILQQTEN